MPDTLAAGATSLDRVLADARATLERAGLPRARREATSLWAAVAGVAPGDVWLARERPAPDATVGRYRDAVRRRAAGAPFAYAAGRVTFRTLDLAIDPRALVPRPETEGLVDLALGEVRGGGLAADIGTGCGCIALSLAVEGAFDLVIAVERSREAAALARENVAAIRPRLPVEVREGDLLRPLGGERCRLIVANPPYLTEAEYEALDPAVRCFEPREALVSGSDGLEATRALLGAASASLVPGGVLALEIDERRAGEVSALARAAGWARAHIREDLFGRPRYALMVSREDA